MGAQISGVLSGLFCFLWRKPNAVNTKSHDLHIALDASNAKDLIKIKALCEMLDISYPALKQRIYRKQDVDTAIKELLAKGGE